MQLYSIKYHTTLSSYFSAQPHFFDGDQQKKPHIRKCMELPFQQTKAQLWDEVTNTLCNLEFIQAKACAKMTYDLVKDFNEVLQEIPDNAENILEENERQARMDKYTRDLISYAKGEITELEIPETAPFWSEEKINAEIERIKTNPTRLDRLKDFKNFLGQEASNLQNYSNEFPHYAAQQAWNYADSGSVGMAANLVSHEIYKSLIILSSTTRHTFDPIPETLMILKAHKESVTAVNITPDGKWAISASNDNTCILWNLLTGKASRTLKGHTDIVRAVLVAPDKRISIYDSFDPWNESVLPSGQNTWEDLKTFKGHVNAVSITPDGKRALSGADDKTCILWDLDSGNFLNILIGHTAEVTSVAITPDGKIAISGSMDNTCILWNLDTGTILKVLKGHRQQVNSVAITADGKTAFSGSHDGNCIQWDLKNGYIVRILMGSSCPIRSVAITPDGKLAISGDDNKICKIWNLTTGQSSKDINGYQGVGSISSLAVTPDGRMAVFGFGPDDWYPSDNSTCVIWDIKASKPLKILTGHSQNIVAVSVTADGQKVFTGSGDKWCILWDLNGRDHLRSSDIQANFIAVSTDGEKAILGYQDSTLRVWDLNSGHRLKTTVGFGESVELVRITPDKRKVVFSSSGDTTDSNKKPSCTIWNLKRGKITKAFETGQIHALVITPDSKRAIIGYQYGFCDLLNLSYPTMVHLRGWHYDRINAIAVTTDCKRAVSCSEDNTCIIWNLKTKKGIRKLSAHDLRVNNVKITPDAKRIISVSEDQTCKIWDMSTGIVVRTFEGHKSPVFSISISPDGKRAITGDTDNNCILWELKTGKIISSFNGILLYYCDAEQFTPDGKCLILSSADKRGFFIINPENGHKVGQYSGNEIIGSSKLFPGGMFAIEESGIILIKLNKELLGFKKSIVTTNRVWDFRLKHYLPYSADCPLCHYQFAPKNSILSTIQAIKQRNRLKPKQSPCMELPDEAWEDPGLLGNCPKCGGELKFNPFVAGGDN
jgi:WD40 repeat protein